MSIYLGKNLKYLRKQLHKTQEGLASELNIGRTTLANYEQEISSPDLPSVVGFAKHLGITVDDLLTRDLAKLKVKTAYTLSEAGGLEPTFYTQERIAYTPKQLIESPKASPTASPKRKKVDFLPSVITVDSSGKENILHVPYKAYAGYLAGYSDPIYLSSLQSFTLPGLRNGTYRMFEVSGPSMAPTIGDKDNVIGEFVESFDDVKDGRVYIVVTKSRGIVVKRLLNRISERGKVVCKSDTIAHRLEYPTYQLDPEDIREMWYARIKFSGDFSEPSEIYHRINDLESDMVEIKQILGNMSLLQGPLNLESNKGD